MDAIHHALGLGPLPRAPVVEYLTRSIAALYAVHGGLLIVVAGDVRRFRPVIVYIGASGIAFGCALLAIDLYARLPWFWTLFEGPPILLVNAMILWLLRFTRATPGAAQAFDGGAHESRPSPPGGGPISVDGNEG